MSAVNTLSVPIVFYSFGIVDCLKSAIERMDRKTRRLLTMNGMQHPRVDVDTLYIKRRDGGRRLVELQHAYCAAIVGLSEYNTLSTDRFTRR